MDGQSLKTMKIAGRDFAVLGHVTLQNSITVPLLNIPMMDDRRERELSDLNAARWKVVVV